MSAYNKNLIAAVQYLYGRGVVKKDKDVSDNTGYHKASVSSYLSGSIKASANFLKKFQEVYKLNLDDFGPGGPHERIQQHDPLQNITELMIKTLATARVNQSILTEVMASQTEKTVMEIQRTVSAAMDAELKQILRELKQEG